MTRRTIGRITLCGTALLAVTAVNAQITKSGAGYQFRMKYTKGQSITYVMNSSGTAQGQAFSMTMPMTQKTLAVQAGVGTVEITLGKMSMLVNGKPMNQQMPTMKPMTVKMDSTGHVVGGSTTQQSMTSVGLPKNPVPVGGSWTASTKAPVGAGGQMDVQATYKFVGFERVGAFNAAKIAISLHGTGQANVTGTGTLWLNATDGSMVKNSTKMNIVMGQMTMPMSLTISRK